MAAVSVALVVRPDRVGHQVWEEQVTKRATPGRFANLRLALVAAAVAFGLVAGVLVSRVLDLAGQRPYPLTLGHGRLSGCADATSQVAAPLIPLWR